MRAGAWTTRDSLFIAAVELTGGAVQRRTRSLVDDEVAAVGELEQHLAVALGGIWQAGFERDRRFHQLARRDLTRRFTDASARSDDYEADIHLRWLVLVAHDLERREAASLP